MKKSTPRLGNTGIALNALGLPADNAPSLLMIGHVVAGYLRFRAGVLGADTVRMTAAFLPRPMFSHFEQLYSANLRGALDVFELESRIEEAIGDPAANFAFVGFSFWGAVLRARPRRRFARAMKLSRGQLARASALFRQRHDRIERAVMRTEMNLKTTIRSSATLHGLASTELQSEAEGPLPFLEILTQRCQLTGDQLATIRVQLSLLRRDVELAHRNARMRFLNMLIRSQRELLDIIEHAQVPPGGPNRM